VTSSSQEPTRSWPFVTLSALSLAAAIAHILFPSLKIDVVTLAFFGVAILPWIAPYIKSVTLPGGLEVVVQDIQRKVGQVQDQVNESSQHVQELKSAVQRLTFQGVPISDERQDEISSAVSKLHDFISRSGLPLPANEPTVRVDNDITSPFYLPDENEILISPSTTTESTFSLYLHHVLGAVYEDQPTDYHRGVLQYGLAWYYEASYVGALSLPKELQNGKVNDPPKAGYEGVVRLGAAWAQIFWRLRELLTATTTDRVLAAAWTQSTGQGQDFYRTFLGQLLKAVRHTGARNKEALIRKWFHEEGIDL
jgi:hypothetical protein